MLVVTFAEKTLLSLFVENLISVPYRCQKNGGIVRRPLEQAILASLFELS